MDGDDQIEPIVPIEEDRSGFRLDRLGLAEWMLGLASVALIIDLLALPWYSLRSTFRTTSAAFGAATSATGAQAHELIGPFAILCALLGFLVWGAQATMRSPALGVCLTAIATLLNVILVIALFVRVVFDPPSIGVVGAPGVDTIRTDIPAVVGLFLSVFMFAGSWLSLRADGVADGDAPQQIETLRLAKRSV